MILKNEFAMVEVEIDVGANGPRLAVRDAASGRVVLLDPLQLEYLAWQPPVFFMALCDPGGRWREDDAPASADSSVGR